jgi:uncharacterized protein YjbJ (UPF0337 family)
MTMDDKDSARERAHRVAEEATHGAAADKAKGHIKEAVGKAKEKIGGAIGDHDLEARGTVQRIEGKKDRLKGEFKDKIDEVKEKVDDVRDRIGAGIEAVKEKLHYAKHDAKK